MGRKVILLAVALLVLIQGPVGALAQDNQTKTLYELMAEQAKRDDQPSKFVKWENGINFKDSASDENGKGVYAISSTLNDLYPIYYYRGEVDNNHVLLEGNCYLIIRTTDTGGVKIMYDGKANEDGTCVDTIFDSNLLRDYDITYRVNSYMIGNEEFKSFPWGWSGKNYADLSNRINWKTFAGVEIGWYDLDDYSEYKYADQVTFKDGKYYLEDPQSYEEIPEESIEGKYTCRSEEDNCEMVYHIEKNGYYNYMIYKNGDTPETVIASLLGKNVVLGSDVKYSNGKYTLVNPISYPIESLDSFAEILQEKNIGTRHYIGISNDSTCETVYYLYDLKEWDDDTKSMYYIELKNGETLETAFKGAWAFYQSYENPSNSKDSEQKSIVDTWYQKNLVTYTNLFEDTIWCDDRDVDYGNFDKNAIFKSNTTDMNYLFSNYKRIWEGTPNLKCSRKVDSFTVHDKEGNQKLKYPVGLLTADEMAYMGTTHQSSCYDYAVTSMSTITPVELYEQKLPFKDWKVTTEASTYNESGISPVSGCRPYTAILPVISVKNTSTSVCGGMGTEEDPYRIGYSACGLEAPDEDFDTPTIPNTSDDVLKYGILFIFSIFLGFVAWFMRRETSEK